MDYINLPPASEGWGGGEVLFSVCQFTPWRGGGYPIWLMGGGYPIPGLDLGEGTLSQVKKGVPHPSLDRAYPILLGGYPVPGPAEGRVLHPRSRCEESHPRSGWGVPHPADGGGGGVLPSKIRMGYPPSPHQETDQHSEHLLLGGQFAWPLAFMQDDFLVQLKF